MDLLAGLKDAGADRSYIEVSIGPNNPGATPTYKLLYTKNAMELFDDDGFPFFPDPKYRDAFV